ncbi:MAG: PxKF domain-containing protein [Caldilineaceae bacterium]
MQKLLPIGFILLRIAIIIGVVATPLAVFADNIAYDGDIVSLDNQTTINLGTVAAGQVLTPQVSFFLTCGGNAHVDDAQIVNISYDSAASGVPAGGAMSATTATFGAPTGDDPGMPAAWPNDVPGTLGTNCPSPAPILNDNGNSIVSITAPTTAGTYAFFVVYAVTLSPPGNNDASAIRGGLVPRLRYNLTVAKSNQSITFDPLPAKSYGDADFTVSATTSSGLPVSFAATGNCTSTGNIVHLTGIGSCTITASQSGDSNYNPAANVAQTFSITQAASTMTVTCPPHLLYTASAITPCTATASGAGLTPVDVSASLIYANNLFAGTATATATWAGDSNHTGSTGVGEFIIDQAPSSVTVDCTFGAPFAYTGGAITPCTATASGVGLLPLDVSATLVYANHVDAGVATATAHWDGDVNHTGNSGSGNFLIDKASSAVTVNCVSAPVIYTGAAITPCTATATGAGMTPVDVSGSLVYVNNVNVGNATANASWDGDANHNGSTGSGAFIIDKASSTVSVDCTAGAPFVYTGVAITPCTATAAGVGLTPFEVSGALVYANHLNVGTATATASWVGDANHSGSSGAVSFAINQALLTIKADDQTILAGTPDPVFTFQTAGFVNGESAAVIDHTPTCTVSAPHTAAGTYVIVCAGGSDNNYNFSYLNGVLVVNPAVIPLTLTGFYQPVDMNGVWNTVKSGATVPLKFELFAGATEVTDTAVVAAFTSAKVTCGNGTEDPIGDNLPTTGGTGLRYDPTSGQFINNWQTPKGAAGTCYRVTLKTQDGAALVALFKLK